jgi:2'-5' RNA ligase
VPRVFFALWPDDPARARLAALGVRVAGEGGGRPVPAANLHLTLAFLGDVAVDRSGVAKRVAAGIRGTAFELALDRLGSFRRAGVGWAGPTRIPPSLAGLQSALDGALRAAGFDLEERAFAAHLTLARKLARPLPAMAIEPGVAWRVERFVLVESARESGRYTEVAAWELGKED